MSYEELKKKDRQNKIRFKINSNDILKKEKKPINFNNNPTYVVYHEKGRNFFYENGDIKEFEEDVKNGKLNISDEAYKAFLHGFKTALKSYKFGLENAENWEKSGKSLEDYLEKIKQEDKEKDKCYLKGFKSYFENLENKKSRK